MANRAVTYYQVRDTGDGEQIGSVVRISCGRKDVRLEIMAGEATIEDLRISSLRGIRIGPQYDFAEITRAAALKLKREYRCYSGMLSGQGATCSA